MPLRPTVGRLFWKLLLALSLSMILSMVGTAAYLMLTNHPFPPPQPDGMPSLGYTPIVPLLSGLIAILVIGLALSWYLSRPLRHLRWALHCAASGHLDTRISPLMGAGATRSPIWRGTSTGWPNSCNWSWNRDVFCCTTSLMNCVPHYA